MSEEKLMSRRLPSLNALRALESVARHGSIGLAARELHVTPAAVSQQVHQLEEWLGTELFRRGRQLTMTDATRHALPLLTQGFDLLLRGVETMRVPVSGSRLVISLPPVFAQRWLVGRLAEFRRNHPEIELQLAPTRRMVDLDAEGIDLAIRFGNGRFPGLKAERLMAEEVLLVAAPEIAARLTVPQDLCREIMLLDDARMWDPVVPDWHDWLKSQGVDVTASGRIQHLGDTNLVLQAAISGLGLALAWKTLVADELVRGTLVNVLGIRLPSARAYYLVMSEYRQPSAAVAVFRDWLMQMAAED